MIAAIAVEVAILSAVPGGMIEAIIGTTMMPGDFMAFLFVVDVTVTVEVGVIVAFRGGMVEIIMGAIIMFAIGNGMTFPFVMVVAVAVEMTLFLAVARTVIARIARSQYAFFACVVI